MYSVAVIKLRTSISRLVSSLNSRRKHSVKDSPNLSPPPGGAQNMLLGVKF